MPPARLAPRPWLAPLLLALATLAAWSNSFTAPFVFDDRPAILANPTLESFVAALSPPRDGGTVAGRPLVNLSLALNRAISGTDVWSYHAFNLAIHLLAGLTLHALLRRTLRFPNAHASTPDPEAVAFAATLLWLLHPLQTAAVTYTVQRAESLAALCLLLALYAFVRARPVLSILACAAGMAAKETAVVIPLIILLYDRTWITGSFRAALVTRFRYYAALASTWLLLAWLVFTNAARAGTAGFATGIAWQDYALTQCRALAIYLKLALWPAPLVFDYGTLLDRSFITAWPFALLIIALLGLVFLAARRHRAASFLVASFLLLLAPTTLVPIATQTIAEHRLYFPLACLVIGAVLILQHCVRHRLLAVILPIALTLATLTFARNRDYRDALTLWADTAHKRPENSRAHNNAGIELARAGRSTEAARHYEFALRTTTRPDAELHHNYATVLLQLDRPTDAIEHFHHAVRLNPSSFPSRLSLATALANAGRPAEALTHFAVAEAHSSLPAEALGTYAALLAQANRLPEAITRYRAALALTPGDARLHYNLGLALARSNELPDAIAAWRDCLRVDHRHIPARVNLANALLLSRRISEAITEYEATLSLDPTNATARANLTRARAVLNKPHP